MKLIDIINNSNSHSLTINLTFHYKGIKVESIHTVDYFLSSADNELLQSQIEILYIENNQLTLKLN